MDSIIAKWKEIVNWQRANLPDPPSDFGDPADKSQIKKIESLLGEKVPEDFRKLYAFSDGEKNREFGLLFGHELADTNQIINSLEFSHTLIKPEHPEVTTPKQSDKLVKKIIEFYTSRILLSSWHRLEFTCAPGSYGGPRLYVTETTLSSDYYIEEYDLLEPVLKELHQLEKESYNWNELKCIVFPDGRYDLKRTYYNFDEDIPFTSSPEGAIKKKYFHYKWLPVFSDYGGNYIGIDLDPDVRGKKGQIINFGRDEEDMVVIADHLESFFDFILNEIKHNGAAELKNGTHLHDVIKTIIKNR